MTSSESQPRTAAGRTFASRIYGLTGIFVEGDISQIEAEAAQDSRPLDVEDVILEFGQWLADDSTRMMRLRDAIEEDQPDEFRSIAAEFATGEPHD